MMSNAAYLAKTAITDYNPDVIIRGLWIAAITIARFVRVEDIDSAIFASFDHPVPMPNYAPQSIITTALELMTVHVVAARAIR